MNVEVGSENGVGVAVRDADTVAVCVADGSAGGVDVAAPDVDEGDGGGRSVGGALVEVSSAVGVSVRRNGVLVGVEGSGAFAGIHNSRHINNNNRKIATTNLNRS